MILLVKKFLKTIVPNSIYSAIRTAILYVTALRYVGDKYECPFCGGHFSIFLPAGVDVPVIREKQITGAGYRLNVLCPRCHSTDRERLVYLFLKESNQEIFSRRIKLLHVAPERNLADKLKSSSNIDYTSVDLNAPLVDLQMDITNIKLPNDTYDMVICNHVLEHIHDDAKAISELFRVLKHGGFAILQVPISYSLDTTFEDSTVTSPEDRELIFGQKDHVRIYGKDYGSRLEKAGFSVATHNHPEHIKPPDTPNYGLAEMEEIFICTKP